REGRKAIQGRRRRRCFPACVPASLKGAYVSGSFKLEYLHRQGYMLLTAWFPVVLLTGHVLG
ncbi:hypothetical protein AMECASPLE_028532, partial [Ameca splendens]